MIFASVVGTLERAPCGTVDADSGLIHLPTEDMDGIRSVRTFSTNGADMRARTRSISMKISTERPKGLEIHTLTWETVLPYLPAPTTMDLTGPTASTFNGRYQYTEEEKKNNNRSTNK